MKKVLVFVNPVLQKTGSRRRAVAGAVTVFRKAGATVEVLETGKSRDAGPKAKQAIAEGYDGFVVCGGDGTVFDAIQGIAGSGIPLGIIPFGTGNVLAQNLKIPSNPVAAARCLLRSIPLSVPLGKITCCVPEGRQSWVFSMSAGMGMHAALLSEARRSGKDVTGRAAYFVAGGRLLFNHPVQTFEVTTTTTDGSIVREQVCEALAVRVAELNRWRPGGGLTFPFLRLATVAGSSRSRLARASFEALFARGGARERPQVDDSAARYQDIVRVVCRPIPHRDYQLAVAVQADGEVLGASFAEIEMAGLDVQFLSARDAPSI